MVLGISVAISWKNIWADDVSIVQKWVDFLPLSKIIVSLSKEIIFLRICKMKCGYLCDAESLQYLRNWYYAFACIRVRKICLLSWYIGSASWCIILAKNVTWDYNCNRLWGQQSRPQFPSTHLAPAPDSFRLFGWQTRYISRQVATSIRAVVSLCTRAGICLTTVQTSISIVTNIQPVWVFS